MESWATRFPGIPRLLFFFVLRPSKEISFRENPVPKNLVEISIRRNPFFGRFLNYKAP